MSNASLESRSSHTKLPCPEFDRKLQTIRNAVPRGPVAVLVRQFPKLSETFILGEIAGLVDAGLDIRIISLRTSTETLRQPDADSLSDRVTYLDSMLDHRPARATNRQQARWLIRWPLMAWRLYRAGSNLQQLSDLLNACEELGVKHIHAHYISEPALLADLASQIRGHTFSISAHAKDIYLTRTRALRRRLRNSAFVTTCTAHNQQFLLQHAGPASSKVHLLYHGINSERFRPAPQLDAGKAPLLIGVGRFKRKKGFDLLIGACAHLVSKGVPFRCEIIGYGDEQNRLQSLIDENRLEDHVSLRKPVSHLKLVKILQGAAVCVVPCRQTEDGDRDGIPNAMLEAMACEIPVVSTTVSGIPEVIQSGINGLLVEPENALALSAAIQTILDNSPRRQLLARRGRQTVTEMFCWEANSSVLGQLLDSTLVNSKCGAST